MTDDFCLMVNPMCPNDLCLLPRGHVGTKRGEHLLGTEYGSAYIGQGRVDLALPHRTKWVSKTRPCFLAPEGTTRDELIEMGWDKARELWPETFRDSVR